MMIDGGGTCECRAPPSFIYVIARQPLPRSAAMPISIKPLLLIIAGLASPMAQAQFLGSGFESNISLTREDLDTIRQTVNQQIHGKPVGTTGSWSNPSSKNSGTIKLLKKFTARNMRCEELGYTLMTTAVAGASPEHYVLDSCLQPDGTWKIL
jgi:surface antigen